MHVDYTSSQIGAVLWKFYTLFTGDIWLVHSFDAFVHMNQVQGTIDMVMPDYDLKVTNRKCKHEEVMLIAKKQYFF